MSEDMRRLAHASYLTACDEDTYTFRGSESASESWRGEGALC